MAVSCLSLTACGKDLYQKYKSNIEKEMRLSFDFFWEEASPLREVGSSDIIEGNLPTYGLIADRYPNTSGTASVASVGYGLSAYVIGVEEGYITREQGAERTEKTLKTMLALQNDSDVAHEGFFAHFINMITGKRVNGIEISSVDTAILLCGAVHAGEYFGGEIKELATELYSNVNWKSIERKKGSKTYLTMGFSGDGNYSLLGNWDWYAEQLMMYVLGAGSPNEQYRLDDKTYYDFTRNEGSYGEHKFIYSWFGSIFTYQFSHAWIDFSGYKDKNGTDWHENSVNASKAAYEFCRDRSHLETFAKGGWGLTACDTPDGYSGHLGAQPRGWSADGNYSKIEATVAPCGALGSVVFTPEESLKALEYYQSLTRLQGKYGLVDAYNLDRNWYANDSIGIDKGITLLMLSNFKNRGVWSTSMNNQYIQNGLKNLGFTAV